MTARTFAPIPNVNAPAYTGDVPPVAAFRKVHAHMLMAGDLYLYKGEVLQVVGVRPFQGNKIDIKAAPLAGGFIVGYAVMREQYVECYRGTSE
jgi:hypothetical protein